MARIKCVETFTDESRNTTYLDVSDAATALGICGTLFGGKVEIFEESTGVTVSEPELVAVGCKLIKVALINETSDKSTFLQMYVKSTVSALDVINNLMGKTIDGVKAEKVNIISSVSYAVA